MEGGKEGNGMNNSFIGELLGFYTGGSVNRELSSDWGDSRMLG